MQVGRLQLEWMPQSFSALVAGELTAQDIHLWTANFSTLRTEQKLLTEAELTRAARYQNTMQRERYLGGRVGLRKLLSAYTGIANADLNFQYGTRGKPELENTSVTFNYTLSGDYALYAIARNRQVGIDLETFPRKVNAAALARRKLTDAEREQWSAFPAAERDTAMLACWTRKESYGKALGVGIRFTMNRVPVCAALNSARWNNAVTGLFAAQPDAASKKLHGVQFALPYPAVAALMFDGGDDVELNAFHITD